MKLYGNLPDDIMQKLAEAVEMHIHEEADIYVYLYDDTLKLKKPETTILITEADKQLEHIEQMIKQGVKEENIIIIPPGEKISLRTLKAKLLQLKETLKQHTEVKDSQQIAVLGFKGGVGRTTLATALTAYYASCGEKTAIVDAGIPPSTVYYMEKPKLIEKSNYKYAQTIRGDIYVPDTQCSELIKELKNKYHKIIIDYSTQKPERQILTEQVIVIVDYDLRTLEITAEQLKNINLKDYILVTNRIPKVYSGIYNSVVFDVLGIKPHIEIQTDSEGCQAVVDTYRPVNDDRGSEIIAAKIGQLAALIQKKGENKIAETKSTAEL